MNCVNNCGNKVKKEGFYCLKCKHRCEMSSNMSGFTCDRWTTKQNHEYCTSCYSIEKGISFCGHRVKKDGKCRWCVEYCANCNKRKVPGDSKLALLTDDQKSFNSESSVSKANLCRSCQTECPMEFCNNTIKRIGDTVCFSCQCKTKGCNKPKIYLGRCSNCWSAFFVYLWLKTFIPSDVVKIILKKAEMPIPANIRSR